MSEEMAYGHLGRSGLVVSRIGLGTMNFGFTADESASAAVMEAAIDTGINFFDTADVYGGPQTPDMEKGYGISEEIIGRWLQRSGRRDDIVQAYTDGAEQALEQAATDACTVASIKRDWTTVFAGAGRAAQTPAARSG